MTTIDKAPMSAVPRRGRLERLDLGALLSTVKAATAITSQLETVLRRSGIGLRANDCDALIFLVVEGPMRPAELLGFTALTESPATLHAILARLEQRGLVERASHPRHKRGVLYVATSDGEAVIDEVWTAIEREVVHRFAGHFSEEELSRLKDLTSRI
jgi:DNA-binding MarR family transcriptional regulator